jgi:pimeloyl-ACP methyl ester carboxylesterase
MGRLLRGLLILIGLVALVAVGGYFFLRRADIPYETLSAQYENAQSRYVDLPGGVRMHYREQGVDGPKLLLIHGYSSSLETWEPWVERLGDEYRLISIDLPGHGLTSAPADYAPSIENFSALVEDFAEAQGLTQFAIAGNSMGGNVAWQYTLAHPERVDALILVAASGWPDEAGTQQNEPIAFKLLRNPAARAVLRDLDITALVREGLQKSFADPALATEAMTTRYVSFARPPGHRDILLTLMGDRAERAPATAELLDGIDRPTLILWGDSDNLVPPSRAELFHDAIANSEVLVFEHVGHLPQEEAADASADTVREFLYRVYEGSALAAE